MELARINADKAEDDEALRKRLWLKIAQHIIQEKNDIKAYVVMNTVWLITRRALSLSFSLSLSIAPPFPSLPPSSMDFLQCCDLIKIEDVLPFFPDFVLIDEFKEQICSALEGYKETIEELKMDMEDATKSADNLRVDIRRLKKR